MPNSLPELIAELTRLSEAATARPWENHSGDIGNRALIVAMRNALPEILKALELSEKALRYADLYGSRGDVDDDGPDQNKSVSFYISEARDQLVDANGKMKEIEHLLDNVPPELRTWGILRDIINRKTTPNPGANP